MSQLKPSQISACIREQLAAKVKQPFKMQGSAAKGYTINSVYGYSTTFRIEIPAVSSVEEIKVEVKKAVKQINEEIENTQHDLEKARIEKHNKIEVKKNKLAQLKVELEAKKTSEVSAIEREGLQKISYQEIFDLLFPNKKLVDTQQERDIIQDFWHSTGAYEELQNISLSRAKYLTNKQEYLDQNRDWEQELREVERNNLVEIVNAKFQELNINPICREMQSYYIENSNEWDTANPAIVEYKKYNANFLSLEDIQKIKKEQSRIEEAQQLFLDMQQQAKDEEVAYFASDEVKNINQLLNNLKEKACKMYRWSRAKNEYVEQSTVIYTIDKERKVNLGTRKKTFTFSFDSIISLQDELLQAVQRKSELLVKNAIKKLSEYED